MRCSALVASPTAWAKTFCTISSCGKAQGNIPNRRGPHKSQHKSHERLLRRCSAAGLYDPDGAVGLVGIIEVPCASNGRSPLQSVVNGMNLRRHSPTPSSRL